jgi:hypothetical protein
MTTQAHPKDKVRMKRLRNLHQKAVREDPRYKTKAFKKKDKRKYLDVYSEEPSPRK